MPSERPIFLTNTMGHKLEEFQPLQPGVVTIYSCGPTVYSYAHTGNFRSFIFADVLRRMFEFNGYEVRHARNITDVGHLTNETLASGLDRIEAAAQKENRTPWDIAQYYIDVFMRDCRWLNLLEPTYVPRATEYIDEMQELIGRLVSDGHAYEADGNVFFEVATFPAYGALSGNTVNDLVAGHRVEVGEGKRAPADFAIWRAAGEDRLMRWGSPWGEGVPGWHIECSAMSMTLLGEQVDIHTGAIDNIFPHHEDEIAQSEAATHQQFVRYWMHGAWLQSANDEKMSKSLGNIFTLEDLVGEGIHPLSYRYFTFQANYRTPLAFSMDAITAAQTALFRLYESVAELIQSEPAEETGKVAAGFLDRFHEAINRDLDMPGAVAVLHEMLGSKLPPGQKRTLVEQFDAVLGLELLEKGTLLSEIDADSQRLVDERAAARSRKDWAQSDALRAQLAERGIEVRDSAQGQRVLRRGALTAEIRELQSGAGNQAGDQT